VLKNLEEADLIQRQTGSIYHRITDPILAAYVEREYQTDYAGGDLDTFISAKLKAVHKRMGSVARMLGEAAELYTRQALLSFGGQHVDAAAIFHLDTGDLRLPKFDHVEHRGGRIFKGETIELDLLAKGEESWLVEVKFRRKPVRLAEVEKFLDKVSKLTGWQIPAEQGKRLWFFSRSGFDRQASARLRELGILHSDLAGFERLCETVGIGKVVLA
jgi:hypothetical protein